MVHWENLIFSQNVKHGLTMVQQLYLLISAQEEKKISTQNTSAYTPIAALFKTAQKLEQPKCLSTDKWIKIM